MQFANFDEFWAALGRLYDETLEMKESIEKLHRAGEQDRELMQAQGELMRVQGESMRVQGKSIGDLAEATQAFAHRRREAPTGRRIARAPA
jgi:hypothetical protein